MGIRTRWGDKAITHNKIEICFIDPISNFEQASKLLEANWKESGTSIDFIAEDARSFYSRLAQMNMLFAIAAYRERILIGYAIITITEHPLNHSIKVCDANGIYLIPELRNGRIVFKMMEEIRKISKTYKVHSINWHASAGSSFSKTLESRYKQLSNYFIEQIDYDSITKD